MIEGNLPAGKLKNQMRQQYAAIRNALKAEERMDLSAAACSSAMELMKSRGVQTMMAYIPVRTELDTRPMIQQAWNRKIQVIVPRTVPSDASMELYRLRDYGELIPGSFGLLEPNPLLAEPWNTGQVPDIIWVPGLVFDLQGGRIGYGGGYYDRLLESWGNAEQRPLWIGMGYSIQLANRVPMEPHDLRLDGLVTEKGWMMIRGNSEGDAKWN